MDDLNFYFSVGIGVQTDCSTPALARFGSDFVKQEFLKPALTGFQDPTLRDFFPLDKSFICSNRRYGNVYWGIGAKWWFRCGFHQI